MAKTRANGRSASQLRPIEIQRGYTDIAPGSVLIRMGATTVLCTATIEETVPKWREKAGLGWVTAEYDMLPGSTGTRRQRRGVKVDGRTVEIQRLIGRVLRSVVDFAKLGPRTIWLDCDVIQADGGTRTAAITGAYIALCDAIRTLRAERKITGSPLTDSVAAISVGKLNGRVMLDLDYSEDSTAEVDFNVAMTGRGRFVEIQGTAEQATFTQTELQRMLALAARGIRQLTRLQKQALGKKHVR